MNDDTKNTLNDDRDPQPLSTADLVHRKRTTGDEIRDAVYDAPDNVREDLRDVRESLRGVRDNAQEDARHSELLASSNELAATDMGRPAADPDPHNSKYVTDAEVAANRNPADPLYPANTANRNSNNPNDPNSAAHADREAGPLFSSHECNDLRHRWDAIQVGFVDEPRHAVEQADSLVAGAMHRLAEIFSEERGKLEHQWNQGENVSTEDLRQALRRYRSFFTRLLSVSLGPDQLTPNSNLANAAATNATNANSRPNPINAAPTDARNAVAPSEIVQSDATRPDHDTTIADAQPNARSVSSGR